jgi:hypothetical protein
VEEVMGARVIISTERDIEPTDRMNLCGIVVTLLHPRIYVFHDEFFEEQLGLILKPELLGTGKPVRANEYTYDFLKQLSKLSDRRIRFHYQHLWIRYNRFWDGYKRASIEYALTKRDYVRACVRAEIEDIGVIASIMDR